MAEQQKVHSRTTLKMKEIGLRERTSSTKASNIAIFACLKKQLAVDPAKITETTANPETMIMEASYWLRISNMPYLTNRIFAL